MPYHAVSAMHRSTPRFLLTLTILLLMLAAVQAQTIRQLINVGDKRMGNGDYYAASLYYKDGLKKNDELPELHYKYAEACRMFNDYKNAAESYTKVVRSEKAGEYPLASFWLAEMLRSAGGYDQAAKQFQRFIGRYKNKDYYFQKAQQDMESCAWAKDHLKKKDGTIKIEHLGKEVNSEASEFNAIHVYPDKLQFSSLRNVAAGKEKEKYLVRIYNQQPNPDPVFTPEGSNLEMNIGNGSYSPDVKRFYFTQCEQKDKTTSRCDIYVSRYENYKWNTAEKLSDSVNNANATNTHPVIGQDAAGGEVLYFVSDRAGGEGNMDIWMSKLNTDGTYQGAVNAGNTINTAGNEVTPFYDANEKKLFFSSDWHYGFGGYDIFETKSGLTGWSKPVNLLTPINTAQNDLYYSRATDNSRSYITSNRVGSYFIEAETCCNDIYAYGSTPAKPPVKPIDTAVVIKEVPVPLIDTIPAIVVKAEPEPQPVKPVINENLKNVKQKLDVTLYFHNDEPNARSLKDTTTLDYKQTYEQYASLINEYKRQYTKGLSGKAKAENERALDTLFAAVDKGFRNLVIFTSQLTDLLQAGNKVEVTVKGYCSPLNYNDYNIKLGYRRVASLRNYFYHYRDGLLLPYIANGALRLVNQSFGEETSARNVSDDLKDIKNSVYSPAAAMERRVELLTIELK